MDYEIEFQRLLDYAKQALSGVNIEKREVLAFAGLSVLDNIVKNYESQIAKKDLLRCEISPDGKHHFDGAIVVCSYCESRIP